MLAQSVGHLLAEWRRAVLGVPGPTLLIRSDRFSSSPNLDPEPMQAITAGFDCHTAMSTLALSSRRVRRVLKEGLLNHLGRYDAAR